MRLEVIMPPPFQCHGTAFVNMKSVKEGLAVINNSDLISTFDRITSISTNKLIRDCSRGKLEPSKNRQAQYRIPVPRVKIMSEAIPRGL